MMLTNHRPGKPFAECGMGRGMRELGTEGDGGGGGMGVGEWGGAVLKKPDV